MALTTSLSDSTRTVIFTYSADNTKMLALLTDAAMWLYTVKRLFPVTVTEGTPPDVTTRDKTWEELTTGERLSIVDQGVKATILKWGMDYYYNQNIAGATETVKAAGENTYAL